MGEGGSNLQVQQPLPMGFGFQANMTYYAEQPRLCLGTHPLVGTSKITPTWSATTRTSGCRPRIAYTYRSHYLVGLDRSSAENQDNYGTLDASVNVNVTPNIALTFDALNLTDNLLKYYADNKTRRGRSMRTASSSTLVCA